MNAGPAPEGGGFKARGLDGLDVVDEADRGAAKLAMLHREADGGLLQPLLHHAQHHEVRQAERNGQRTQHRIIADQHHGKEGERAPVQHRIGHVGGDHLRHPLARLDAGGNFTGAALGEEGHGQMQHPPDEGARAGNRQLGAQSQDQRGSEPCEAGLYQGRQTQRNQQRARQMLLLLHQDAIDEDLGEDRQHHTGDDERKAQKSDQPQRPMGRRDTRAEGGEQPLGLERLAEGIRLVEGQHHTGEGFAQLLTGDDTRPQRRIVDIGMGLRHALENHIVVEVPVQDGWPGQIGQRLRLLAEALGGEAILPGSLQQAAGLGAITRNAAGNAQLFQRNPGAVMGEDHGKAGRTAFHRLHLQDGGRGLAAALCGFGGRVRAHAAAHPASPETLRSQGMT